MSNHPKGKMILPTTNPNRLDVEWYAQECAWMQVELGKLKTENAALRKDKEQMRDALQTALGSLCSAAIREGVAKHIEAVLSNTKETQL